MISCSTQMLWPKSNKVKPTPMSINWHEWSQLSLHHNQTPIICKRTPAIL